jgi:hypothetical protein
MLGSYGDYGMNQSSFDDGKWRDTQTKIKHKILEKYLGTWSGIILNGLRQVAGKFPNPV